MSKKNQLTQILSISFKLETDACIKGRLGAVLSQCQEGGLMHPIASASCTLSGVERNYSITEMECSAFSCLSVWA